jgi:hypothetical protein
MAGAVPCLAVPVKGDPVIPRPVPVFGITFLEIILTNIEGTFHGIIPRIRERSVHEKHKAS